MKRLNPARSLQLIGRKTDILLVTLIEEIGEAIRSSGPRECRDRIDRELEIALVRGDCVLRALAIFDVSQQDVPADDSPGWIARRNAAIVEPSIRAVEATQTLFDLVGTPAVIERPKISATCGMSSGCTVPSVPRCSGTGVDTVVRVRWRQ
jgi:hypothetical protein